EQVEYTRALERTMSKELGKMTPDLHEWCNNCPAVSGESQKHSSHSDLLDPPHHAPPPPSSPRHSHHCHHHLHTAAGSYNKHHATTPSISNRAPPHLHHRHHNNIITTIIVSSPPPPPRHRHPHPATTNMSSSTSLNSLLEETNTIDNSLPEFETFCFEVEEISNDSTTTHSNISHPEYEVFHDDHVKEISSGSPTTHFDSSLYESFIFDLSINPFPPADRSDFYEFADELIHFISPPEYDCFLFKVTPNSRDFTKDVVEDISPTKKPKVHNALLLEIRK
nr:hypothetical protein [Tanacetum cinerariifolium]